MLNSQQVWLRVRKLRAFSQLNEFDFRPVYYKQAFAPAAGVTTAYSPQDFPNGAIIIGITAAAHVAGAAPATGQSAANRQLFGIDFQFSNTDAIVVNGPVNADALLGGGENNIFPAREIIIPPGSKVNCRVENYTNAALVIHVVYHALAYRTNA